LLLLFAQRVGTQNTSKVERISTIYRFRSRIGLLTCIAVFRVSLIEIEIQRSQVIEVVRVELMQNERLIWMMYFARGRRCARINDTAVFDGLSE